MNPQKKLSNRKNSYCIKLYHLFLNRWLFREYEKLRCSSKGLTIHSINSWLSSHLGIVGEKENLEREIAKNVTIREDGEITDTVFKAVYNYFVDKQQAVSYSSY